MKVSFKVVIHKARLLSIVCGVDAAGNGFQEEVWRGTKVEVGVPVFKIGGKATDMNKKKDFDWENLQNGQGDGGVDYSNRLTTAPVFRDRGGSFSGGPPCSWNGPFSNGWPARAPAACAPSPRTPTRRPSP
jgi:hypothetical protein